MFKNLDHKLTVTWAHIVFPQSIGCDQYQEALKNRRAGKERFHLLNASERKSLKKKVVKNNWQLAKRVCLNSVGVAARTFVALAKTESALLAGAAVVRYGMQICGVDPGPPLNPYVAQIGVAFLASVPAIFMLNYFVDGHANETAREVSDTAAAILKEGTRPSGPLHHILEARKSALV